MEIPVFQFVLFLVCFHWVTLRKVWLHLLYLPYHVFIHIDQFPLSLLFPGENDLRCLSLYVTCSSPIIIFMSLHWTYSNMSVSLLLGSSEPESAFYMSVGRTEKRARIAFLVLLKVLSA